MSEEILFKMLGNIGVPAAICFYTLFRVNQTLRDLTNAINKLTSDTDRRLERLEDKTRELTLQISHRKEFANCRLKH